jgi:hypothetical protein
MTAALESKILTKSYAALQSHGSQVTWKSWTRDGTQYDPGTGVQPASSVTHVVDSAGNPIKVAVGSHQSTYSQSGGIPDTTKVGTATVTLVSVNLPFTPKKGDEVEFRSEWWFVESVETIPYDTVIVGWTCTLRRTG